jgi:osmotically-inducible protein OsmY
VVNVGLKGEIPMSQARLTVAGISVLILSGVLPGCATYEKCGIDGCPGDHKITANVQAAFDRYPELGEPNSISVQTLNHVVYLSGGVSEGAMRDTAESVALKVKGVARVEDTIYVAK